MTIVYQNHIHPLLIFFLVARDGMNGKVGCVDGIEDTLHPGAVVQQSHGCTTNPFQKFFLWNGVNQGEHGASIPG